MSKSCPFCDLLVNPQINSTFIAEFQNSVAFLNFNQGPYPGQSLLIFKNHHEHLHLVPILLQQQIVPELASLTQAILDAFGGFRANHESLGNSVGHVHWHIVPRYPGDLNAGGPPLYAREYIKLSELEYTTAALKIREKLI